MDLLGLPRDQCKGEALGHMPWEHQPHHLIALRQLDLDGGLAQRLALVHHGGPLGIRLEGDGDQGRLRIRLHRGGGPLGGGADALAGAEQPLGLWRRAEGRIVEAYGGRRRGARHHGAGLSLAPLPPHQPAEEQQPRRAEGQPEAPPTPGRGDHVYGGRLPWGLGHHPRGAPGGGGLGLVGGEDAEVAAHDPEGGTHLPGGLEPGVGIFLQGLADQGLQRLRQGEIATDVSEARRGLGEVLAEQIVVRFALEGQPPGEHAVEHHPEGVEIGPGVHLAQGHLLWGHVVGGAADLPLLGDLIPDGVGGGLLGAVLGVLRDVLGDAEVEDLHVVFVLVALDEEQVARLEISVHHPLLVSGLQGLEHLLGDVDRPGHREVARLLEQPVERAPDQHLHDQIELAVWGLPVVMHDGGVGVADVGGDPGPTGEAPRRRGVRRRQHLDGHGALCRLLPRLPDGAVHAPNPDEGFEDVSISEGVIRKIDHQPAPVVGAPIHGLVEPGVAPRADPCGGL